MQDNRPPFRSVVLRLSAKQRQYRNHEHTGTRYRNCLGTCKSKRMESNHQSLVYQTRVFTILLRLGGSDGRTRTPKSRFKACSVAITPHPNELERYSGFEPLPSEWKSRMLPLTPIPHAFYMEPTVRIELTYLRYKGRVIAIIRGRRGAACRARTDDFFLTMEVLYLLS